MAISFVNGGTLAPSASATSVQPSLPTSLTAGDVLIAYGLTTGAKTIAVSGTGWSLIETFNNGTVTGAWAKYIALGSGDVAPTFSWTGASACVAFILHWTGNDTSNPVGNITHNLGTGTTISINGITTTRANSVVSAVLQTGTSNNIAPLPTNYTNDTTYNQTTVTTSSVRACHELISASGGTADNISVSVSSANWRAWMVEIKAPVPATNIPLHLLKNRITL